MTLLRLALETLPLEITFLPLIEDLEPCLWAEEESNGGCGAQIGPNLFNKAQLIWPRDLRGGGVWGHVGFMKGATIAISVQNATIFK